MTIANASYADAANGAILISTTNDGDVYVQDITNPDDPYAVALSAWVAAGGVIAPYDPPLIVPELDRVAFCEALITAGILTEADAESAALGNWPASFEPALAGKTFAQKVDAKSLWQSAKTVPKNAPLFLDLLDYYAGVSGLDDAGKAALADQIFAGA
jgi:hypothetical protein